MTNRNKWLIAIPFTISIALVIPGLVAGSFSWFRGHWGDAVFIFLTVLMWLLATAFVDVQRSRERRDPPRVVLSLVLILAVPAAVSDRIYWTGSSLSPGVVYLDLAASIVAISIGVSARVALGRQYSPEPAIFSNHQLVTDGPYRFIRHPLYLAALLWFLGWPLMVRSVGVAVLLVCVLLPVLIQRMNLEEGQLVQEFGQDYVHYQGRTKRLIPHIY